MVFPGQPRKGNYSFLHPTSTLNALCDHRGVGVGLTHTEKLFLKKLKIARKIGDFEAETCKDCKRPDIGRVLESFLPFKMSTQAA